MIQFSEIKHTYSTKRRYFASLWKQVAAQDSEGNDCSEVISVPTLPSHSRSE